MLIKQKRKKGFTLVELMIVISIITILSTVGLSTFGAAQQSARNAKRKADIQAIAAAIEVHYVDPPSSCSVPSTVSSTIAGSYCPAIPSWFASGIIPSDPLLANPPTNDTGYCIVAYDSVPSTDGAELQLEPTGNTTNQLPPFNNMPSNSDPLSITSQNDDYPGNSRCMHPYTGGYWSLHTDNLPTGSLYGKPYQGSTYWKICANLEPFGTGVYCVDSKRAY